MCADLSDEVLPTKMRETAAAQPPSRPALTVWMFLRNALTYGGGTLAGQAVSFLLLPIYTRYLTPADYGILDILQRTGDLIVLILMGQGLAGATFTFYCQEQDLKARAVVAATTISVIWVMVLAGLAGAIIFAGPLSAALSIDDAKVTQLGLIAVLCQLLLVIPMSLMQARMEALSFVITSLISSLARLLLIIVAVVGLGAGIYGVLWGTIIAFAVAALVVTVREFRRFGFRPDLRRVPPILKFALPFVPLGALGFVRTSSSRFFLLEFFGPNDVGIYAFAARIVGIVGIIAFMPLFKVWSALLYKVYAQADGPEAVGLFFLRLLAPSVFVSLGVVLFRREIVQLLGDSGYIAGITLIAPFCLAQLLETAQTLLDGAFYFARRSSFKLYIIAATTVVCVAVNALLIPGFGASGAAWAYVLQAVFYAGLTFMVAQRVYRIRLDWRRLLLGSGLAVALALPTFVAPAGFVSWPEKTLLWLAWLPGLWCLGGLRHDEKALIRTLLRRGFRRDFAKKTCA